MSYKGLTAAYVSSTGAGIAVGGTGAIGLTSVIRASDVAGTVILKDSATIILTMSADRLANWQVPIILRGPVTMTSSGGDHFVVGFVKV